MYRSIIYVYYQTLLSYRLKSDFPQTNCYYFAILLYLSDITSRSKSRTFAIAFLECAQGAVTTSLDVLKGHLIQVVGFTLPATITVACVSAA